MSEKFIHYLNKVAINKSRNLLLFSKIFVNEYLQIKNVFSVYACKLQFELWIHIRKKT